VREEDRKLIVKLINAGYRTLAKELHPDTGGSTAAMARLADSRNALLANHKLPRLPRWLRNAVNSGLKQQTADSLRRE
jgi:CRISPR/Cas system Type II protein with McrA/HNH and RuvC-like nuclease domain